MPICGNAEGSAAADPSPCLNILCSPPSRRSGKGGGGIGPRRAARSAHRGGRSGDAETNRHRGPNGHAPAMYAPQVMPRFPEDEDARRKRPPAPIPRMRELPPRVSSCKGKGAAAAAPFPLLKVFFLLPLPAAAGRPPVIERVPLPNDWHLGCG